MPTRSIITVRVEDAHFESFVGRPAQVLCRSGAPSVKQNATARGGDGAVCVLAGNAFASTTLAARRQAMRRAGVPERLADLVAELAFGDAKS